MKKCSAFMCVSLIMAALLLAVGCAPQSDAFAPQGTSPGGTFAVVINEVVSSNKYSFFDGNGDTPDFVELLNTGSQAVDLTGWGLSDDEQEPYRFTFPSIRIEAGAYLLVLADGLGEGSTNSELRAPFALAKAGETLFLSDQTGNLVQELTIPELQEDIAWGRNDDGAYKYFASASPGAYNQGPQSDTMQFDYTASGNSTLKINEVLPSNDYSVRDEDGDRPDWLEITNIGSEAVDMSGYGLGKGTERLSWRFPSVTLQPGEYLIVFCSEKDRANPEGNLHTNFKLSAKGDQVNLCDASGAILDGVSWDTAIPANISYGRNVDDINQWLYYGTATPGKANTTKGFESIDHAMGIDPQGVWINEAKAVSEPREKQADWIELANGGGQPFSLQGYGLSDDKNDPFQYTFGDTSVPAGGYLVIETGTHAKDGMPVINISSSGKDLMLFNPDGEVVDLFSTGAMSLGVTSGRQSGDSSGRRYFFSTATPGAANQNPLSGYTQPVEFSVPGGYVNGATTVELSSPTAGATIYYTTDGSQPGTSSRQYTGPIGIDSTTVVRAVAVYSGLLPSDIATATYLLEQRHDIPVVCLSAAPDDLFSESRGILANGPGWTDEFPHVGANYWKDWERPIHFEFYEQDGTLGTSFPAGIRVHGQYSRSEEQKSMAVFLRGAYGVSEVTYPFFRDYDVTTFTSLILRTSGQDWVHTKLRDAFFAQAVKETMDMDYMEYRPVAVYINGRYWGLYNLREKTNESYLEQHYGVDPDNVDIIKGNKNALSGNTDAFLELREYMKSHNLSDQAVYDKVAAVLDVDNFMDYAIVETYFNNTDTGNIKFWRERTDDGKWRMILFDMDWGMFPSTYKWNMIEEFFDDAGHGVGNNFFTHIQCGLMQNSGWRDRFYERYAWHIQNTFAPERLNALIDRMAGEIRSEIPRHVQRWGKPGSADTWEKSITRLKEMVSEKPTITKEDLQETFGLTDARMRELFGE